VIPVDLMDQTIESVLDLENAPSVTGMLARLSVSR